MAELKLIQNGVRKAKANPRKRKTTRRRKRRNGIATASAVKRNPVKRARRNGVTARRRNGFFGDTKTDVKNVLSLTGGAIGTNIAGNAVASALTPYIASIGLGAYSSIITQLAIALFGVPYVAKALAGQDAAKMARLGGLLSVTLDVLGTFFPQFNSLNPFTTSPIVVSGNQVGLMPNAVAQIAQGAADETAAKIAGFANQLQAMNAGSGFANPSGYLTGGELVM